VPCGETATRHIAPSANTARRRRYAHPRHRNAGQPVWPLWLLPDYGAAPTGRLACWQGPGGEDQRRTRGRCLSEDAPAHPWSQIRQEHWAIVDLVGKGGRIRTVRMPVWVKGAIDRWVIPAEVTEGRMFRAVSRHGTPLGRGISENVIWYVVRRCAERMQLEHVAPHDLRRTCAKLCHVNGGELEQVQFLL
jgi:hypothetical protein